MQFYLVGGAVRDQLLGRKVVEKDWLVVGATPQQMLDRGYQQVGSDFPVFLHPKNGEEYALARTERKSATGYTGFECFFSPDVTVEEDLLRRDLTVNAMVQTKQGEIIDPYGGQQDLINKILRHVSPAFVEDPLRVLRVARFAARYAHLGFTIADETLQVMTQLSDSGELDHLTAERVWKETSRALTEADPQVYFEVLRECGALEILFPEIDALWGVPNPEKWHPEIDTGIHTMMVVKQARILSEDLAVVFAALLHDLGKAKTDPVLWPKHYGHEKAGIGPIKQLCQRLKVPNNCRDLALLCCQYHTHVHKAFELRSDTVIKLFDSLDVWRKPQRLDDFLTVSLADSRGRTGFETMDVPQVEYLKNCYQMAVAVDVQDIIKQGFKGPDIRAQLAKARTEVIKALKPKNLEAK